MEKLDLMTVVFRQTTLKMFFSQSSLDPVFWKESQMEEEEENN